MKIQEAKKEKLPLEFLTATVGKLWATAASVAVGRTPLCAALAFAVFASAKWHSPAKSPVSAHNAVFPAVFLGRCVLLCDLLHCWLQEKGCVWKPKIFFSREIRKGDKAVG